MTANDTIESPPPYENFDAWAEYYWGVWGLDPIPVSTIDKNLDHKDKRVKWFADWLDYKNGDSMSQEKFEEFKTDPRHSYSKLKGIGLIVGQIKRGPNKGYWINFLDADNEKGKECILEILGYSTIDELKRDCVIEYHPSAPNKVHVYILSEVPLANFTLSTDRDSIKRNDTPGIEIKGEGSGLAYSTPSLYAAEIGKETGEHYQLIEGSISVPARIFTERDIQACETRLYEIGKRYNNTSYGKADIASLIDPKFRVTEGNNRKRHILLM